MRDTLEEETGKVIGLVKSSIDMEGAELVGEEFFPAHLPVALVDAVYNPQLDYEKRVVPIVEGFCRGFGLRRSREERRSLPPVDEQLTLTELINHYESPGGKEWMRK